MTFVSEPSDTLLEALRKFQQQVFIHKRQIQVLHDLDWPSVCGSWVSHAEHVSSLWHLMKVISNSIVPIAKERVCSGFGFGVWVVLLFGVFFLSRALIRI